ncbi:MAG: 2'-deoxycytidine 5'-triphosphate deaminase [Rhodospirillaceae bacterium]|nr:2'-deoxycytidine 5'-triphosphate deaminase [Rhodospirillaceae bacterium]
MADAGAQAVLPIVEEAKVRSGIYPAQWFPGAIARGVIRCAEETVPGQIQPASIDLRLGSTAYRVPASFLPGRKHRVEDKLAWLAEERIDLTHGAVLERNQVYIVPLLEHLDLKKRMTAAANPKSSTGRLDVFARVIADYATEFDSVAEQYAGPLWVEIAPRSFRVIVRKGSRLVQLRVRRGLPRSSEKQLKELHRQVGIVRGEDDAVDIRRSGIAISVDIAGDDPARPVGFKARTTDACIDVDKVGFYDPDTFWTPVFRPASGGIVLDPKDFHILASKEAVTVPDDHAADMIAYDTLVGEFRVHYAGFFDPGFGHSPQGQHAARAVLEVRSHEVPFIIEDGQIMGRLIFEPLTERTDTPYGTGIGSSYQYQGLALSKHFKKT